MWGFSAGAELVHRWCQDDNHSYRTLGHEAPGMIGLIYGGMVGDFPNKASEVPVYMCMGENDSAFGEEGPKWFQEYAAFLEENGVTVRYELVPDTGHGFGNGYGTNADGWVKRAVDFWLEVE